MPRHFTHDTLLIASGNAGKVREISELLSAFPLQVMSASGFALEEPEETGADFVSNAELKARYYGKATGLPALADDSGLVVPALGGAPGIYSARWAGPNKDFAMAMERIRQELIAAGCNAPWHEPAHFVCALSLYWPEDGHVETVEGKVHGHLCFPPRGEKGFGYDPLFIAEGYDITFAEMEPAEKHRISHRADAFEKLIEACFTP